MADSWLRGFQTCLEVHLEQHSSQLPPASPSPFYFPWGPGTDCFNRFTASSGSRCYYCDYVLSQGSHSLREPVMITDSFSISQLCDLKKQQYRFYFAFPVHTTLHAICQKEFGEGPKSCLPNSLLVLVTSRRMCIHFHIVKVTHCKTNTHHQNLLFCHRIVFIVNKPVSRIFRNAQFLDRSRTICPILHCFKGTARHFGEIRLLVCLQRSAWEDGRRSHICPFNLKLQPEAF